MSTRGGYGFIIDGKEKISYNHLDSSLSGLGNKMLNFINNADLEEVKKQVRALILVTHKIKPTQDQMQKCIKLGLYNKNIADKSADEWYCLLRNAQGDLKLLLDVGYMEDYSWFLNDSLFCEWAYIINLDTNKFEVYKGFNTNSNGKGRYANSISLKRFNLEESLYYGVTLIAEYDLDNLPKSLDALERKIYYGN